MNTPSPDNDLAIFMLAHIADHGRLEYEDYRQAWEVAMADGVLDERERRILQRLFDLLPPGDMPPEVEARIDELRRQYSL